MLKRLFCLMLALLMCPLAALAEASDASALSWSELHEWADGLRQRAMQTQPLNDPTAPEALSEDGYAFIYDFATLYMDRPEMSEASVMRGAVILAPETTALRNTGVDMLWTEVLGAYYNENPLLEGDRAFAALYAVSQMPDGAVWGWVQRDGQRVMTIQYAVHEQLPYGADGYSDCGIVYTMQDNVVAAIRIYGLDAVVQQEDVQGNMSAVMNIMEKTEYRQVPVSFNGLDLTAFGPEDAAFEGLDFLSLTPEAAEAALGTVLEDVWMEDDTLDYIRVMSFEGCEVTFIYDAAKQNPRVSMVSLTDDSVEGPRCVRLGDTFSSVLCRFRYGENDLEGLTELLYGDQNASYGMAEYGGDASATLRYVSVSGGQTVTLYMYFTRMSLTEVLMYVEQ